MFYARISYENLRNVTSFCGKVSKTGSDIEGKSIIIRTKTDTITMETQGAEVWAKTEIEAEIHDAGEVAVPGKFFSDIVAALAKVLDQEEILELGSTGSELVIQTTDGVCKRQVTQIALTDFTGRPDYDGDSVEVQLDFLEHIKTANSAAADPGNLKLSGVHIHSDGLVATDGFKFIIVDMDLGDNLDPVTINSSLIKFFPAPDSYGDGEIYFGTTGRNGLASFKFGRNELISATMSSEYPKVELIKAILPPDTSPHYMKLDVDEFKNVVEALAPFNITGFLPVTIHPDGRIIIITPEQDNAEEQFDYKEMNLPRFVNVGLTGLTEIKSLMRGEETCKFLFAVKEEDLDKKPLVVKKDNVTFGLMPHRNS